MSSHWTLRQGGKVIGELTRMGRTYVSAADLGDMGRMILEPCGTGVVHAVDEHGELARITRNSWLGRLWEITGARYNYDLVSDPRPRRWHLEVANGRVTDIAGSLVSYNHVRIHSALTVPISAILLSWHVIARPWEAIAEPRGLVPIPRRRGTGP